MHGLNTGPQQKQTDMHFSILEELENNTSAQRLVDDQKVLADARKTIEKAARLIENQEIEIDRLTNEIISLRRLNKDLRKDLARISGDEFKNEDYPD